MSMRGDPEGAGTAPSVRVLIVDDNADLRDLLGEALGRDHRVVVVGTAADGRAAVREAQRTRPDVVLLDLAMPEYDGLEALPALRTLDPAPVIVILSAFRTAPLWPKAAAGGALGYLEKGIGVADLARRLLVLTGTVAAAADVLERHVLRLPDGVGSPRVARRLVAGLLDDWQLHDLVDTVQLLTSELVTNALRYAGGPPQLVVQLTEEGVRVEVHDDSPMPPRVEAPGPDTPTGRGLALVEQLALAWGVEPRPGGKAVWFLLPMP